MYDAEFHADRDTRTRSTARAILTYLFEKIEIESVCDVGCGVGTWLSAAQELGAERIKGYEGPWAEKAQLVIDLGLITLQDLEVEVRADERFDLVISLEVAEHLTATRGPAFIAELCALGDLVLFSAAIPDQGGTGHVNERWQSYWAGVFAEQGYEVFDVIRPAIWQEEAVPWWYRQNILVYAKQGSTAAEALAGEYRPAVSYLDVVHPELFRHAEANQPARSLRKAFRNLLGRG